MARVDAFNKGREEKDDEFYTRYEDIQAELNHYEKQFEGKTVLCNCDDPFESNFCKFFLKNFNYLKLKRLICTSYADSPVIGQQLTLFDYMDEPVVAGNGYVMDISAVPMANGRGVSDDDIKRLLNSKKRGVKKLKGNGDFASDECVEYLKQADIVCTNPPFSKWEDFVKLIMKYDKAFLVIGRETNTTIKDVFAMFRDNRVWYGYTHAKEFIRPDGSIRKFGNVAWFTNLDVSKRHEKMIMYKAFSDGIYPHYYNYDGIDVEDVASIPKDYYGNMGVPSSFLFSYNPEQFQLIGLARDSEEVPVDRSGYEERKKMNPNTRPSHIGYYLSNGQPKEPFGRIIIRRKSHED